MLLAEVPSVRWCLVWSRAFDWGWDNGRVIGAGILGAALAILFVRRSARHPAPLLDGALLRIRSLSVANGLMVLAAAAYFGVILNNVLFLTTVWGWSMLQAGLAPDPRSDRCGDRGRSSRTPGGANRCQAAAIRRGAVWAAGIAGYLVLTRARA